MLKINVRESDDYIENIIKGRTRISSMALQNNDLQDVTSKCPSPAWYFKMFISCFSDSSKIDKFESECHG